ncbi:MAG: redoxin domain-containing protein [Proteobacteria bacterium]|nr:redoxin domain-containing protein [Pseudomonadota bacterium]
MPTKYNYDRYKMSEYELGKFPGAKAGEEAPNFTLRTQVGKEVTLDDYKGKWLVIETGSITCGMYVKNVPGWNKLKAEFPDIEFLLVYVREAHPGSRLGAHQSEEQKMELSKNLNTIYKDERPVLVDNLDGDMHRLYGGLPNVVYVINPEGKVIYRCDWSFPKLVRRVLLARDHLHTDEHVQIITAAPWIMIPVVLRGGWDALWDISIALPFITIAHIKADWANFKKKFSGNKTEKASA